MRIDGPGTILAAFALVLVLVFVIYIATAKGANKKITITNPDSSEAVVSVEVADSLATRAKGLMGRKSFGACEGMLFVFDAPAKHPLWMFNTTIPLDAIYISENGTVVEVIAGMEPCGINPLDCPNYTPQKEAKYILEVNKGFAERHRVVAGKSRVELP